MRQIQIKFFQRIKEKTSFNNFLPLITLLLDVNKYKQEISIFITSPEGIALLKQNTFYRGFTYPPVRTIENFGEKKLRISQELTFANGLFNYISRELTFANGDLWYFSRNLIFAIWSKNRELAKVSSAKVSSFKVFVLRWYRYIIIDLLQSIFWIGHALFKYFVA